MENSDAKQLIIDRVKQATNILVTVENNPSVDELAAALALTLMLNKMDKHATAVFSGAVPPAINFLEPTKTFESTVDSLRDFIIALDKEKADRLRYKVEDDVVKIFITPYQSTITEKDLNFSQGDFNVEVVMALGVEKRESLDRAIAAHGRILHDATVITINARNDHSSLGAIDWQDGKASSISEMLVGLADGLQPKLLDAQISTALLTGIVAATDRFGNDHTSPHAMTLAAELMAAGANQQLIANNLRKDLTPKADEANVDTGGKISRDESAKPEGEISEASKKVTKEAPATDGSKGEMKVRHEEAASEEKGESADKPAELQAEPTVVVEPAEETPAPPVAPSESDIPLEDHDELKGLRDALNSVATTPPPSAPATKPAPRVAPAPAPTPAPAASPFPKISPAGQSMESHERPNWQRLEPPTLGGTLNATSAEAEESRRREAEEEAQHNNVTLNHGGGTPSGLPNRTIVPERGMMQAPPTAAPTPPTPPPAASSLPPLQQMPPAGPSPNVAPLAPAPASSAPVKEPTLAQTEDDLEAARKAVNDALGGSFGPEAPAPTPPPAAPAAPAPTPAPTPPPASGMPPMPDFSTLPPLPPMPGSGENNPLTAATPSVAPGTDVTAQFVPPTPNATPGGTPLPPPQAPPAPPAPGQVSSDPNNPNQFRIPGQ